MKTVPSSKECKTSQVLVDVKSQKLYSPQRIKLSNSRFSIITIFNTHDNSPWVPGRSSVVETHPFLSKTGKWISMDTSHPKICVSFENFNVL